MQNPRQSRGQKRKNVFHGQYFFLIFSVGHEASFYDVFFFLAVSKFAPGERREPLTFIGSCMRSCWDIYGANFNPQLNVSSNNHVLSGTAALKCSRFAVTLCVHNNFAQNCFVQIRLWDCDHYHHGLAIVIHRVKTWKGEGENLRFPHSLSHEETSIAPTTKFYLQQEFSSSVARCAHLNLFSTCSRTSRRRPPFFKLREVVAYESSHRFWSKFCLIHVSVW